MVGPNADGVCTTESLDEYARTLLNTFEVDTCSYDDLCGLVGQLLVFAERHSLAAGAEWAGQQREPLRRLTCFFAKRHFAAFRSHVGPRSPLEAALVELFLQTRIRTYVLAYLSVQEGEDFEGGAAHETCVPLFISQLLHRLGRISNCTLNPGIGWLRLRFDIDPLVALRKLYGVFLFGQRRGKLSWSARAALAYHRMTFSLRSRVLALVIRVATRNLVNGDVAAGIGAMFRLGIVRRLLATAIFVLFPCARELTETDWIVLLRRVEEYFVPRIIDLLAAMPDESFKNHGLIKLCKVAFGTIAGRTSVREVHEKDIVEFIFNTLRIAYSWGVTYPLVDNVLDSVDTTPRIRSDLTDALQRLFSGTSDARQPAAPECANVGVREVHRRLAEVLDLVPAPRQATAQRFLSHLLKSHFRDSSRRLSALGSENEAELRTAVMVDTGLKAALVRLATMQVCGIAVDRATLARSLVRSIFNQLGDDLWDIYEDFGDDRVTPFTLYLTRGGPVNPFRFYFDYSVLLARGLTRRRRAAVFMGFCETLRDSMLAIEHRADDPLEVGVAITEMLEHSAQVSGMELVSEVPHVDFDAVLFAVETALMDITLRG